MKITVKLVAVILFFSLIYPVASVAQVAVLTGNAPSYSGDEIVFYTYSDYVTMAESEIGRCAVGANGDFSCKLSLLTTSLVFSHLGVYKVYFFAERGGRYELVLPPKEEKTEAQRLNPFFREEDLQVGIKNVGATDINRYISSFDMVFNENFDDVVMSAYKGSVKLNVDSLIAGIEARFIDSRNQFFNDYRRYRYGLLKHLTMMQKSRSISDEYFLNNPVRYNNPAYMELFNLTYNKYFIFFSRTAQGNAIFKDISKDKSLPKLKKTLGTNKVLANDTLKELVILKGLFDEFFNDEFSRSALLSVLEQVYRSAITDEHIIIAENIRNRITRLLPGFVPMPFALADTSGNDISLDKFNGKYVYLNFCTTSSYTCIQEFALLQKLYDRYKQRLEIVTILTDKDKRDIAPFLKSTGYNWTFLHYGNKPDIIKDYDVRVYPTYYLIGPDQKLIMSPAPTPRENFEVKFFQIMRGRGDI